MFSRRSLFALLGLALPMAAVASAEAATARNPARRRRTGRTAAARQRRDRRAELDAAPADTAPVVKG